MSARIKRNAPLIRALYYAAPKKRRDILAHGSPDFIQALCEIALNVLKGNVPLSKSQYSKLKTRKKVIRLLVDKRTGFKRKQQALAKQTGGFLPILLSTVLPILGGIIGDVIQRK